MAENSDGTELLYVPMSTGDLLYFVTRLALATQTLTLSVEVLSRGDPTNAGRLAAEASQKIEEVVDGIVARLKEAVDVTG